jgi:hypothetical protein
MTTKINKALEEFIKREFLKFFTEETNKFLNLEFDDEKITELTTHLEKCYDEKYLCAAKKRTPRTPKGAKKEEAQEEDTNINLSYDDMMKKINDTPDCVYCGWVYGRGENRDKFCAKVVKDSSQWSDEDKTNFVQRCQDHIRHNTMKKDGINVPNKDSIDKNTKRVMAFKIGSQVRGTPVKDVTQLPDTQNEMPVETLAGINKDIVSPTPESFLEGKQTGSTTPTKAKSKRKSPAKFKVKKLKHGESENKTDYRSSDKINGNYILVRCDSEQKFTFGGKFENEEDLESKLYLQGVIELDEDDLEQLKEYSYEYEYCGSSVKKSPDMLDIPNLDDEDGDDDDNVDDLLEGLDIN